MNDALPLGQPADPIGAALAHLVSKQDASGSWKGDYGGPLFLLPIFIAIARTVGFSIDAGTRSGMAAYLRAHQNEEVGCHPGTRAGVDRETDRPRDGNEDGEKKERTAVVALP